jgi:hypothetical protein
MWWGGQWTWVQGHREWLNEVYFLGRFRHPNLVRLIGFCAQLTSVQEERLLVYEFVLHGSLENLLFQSTSFFMPMPWNRRVDVAVDAACGLTFLHDHQVGGWWEMVVVILQLLLLVLTYYWLMEELLPPPLIVLSLLFVAIEIICHFYGRKDLLFPTAFGKGFFLWHVNLMVFDKGF